MFPIDPTIPSRTPRGQADDPSAATARRGMGYQPSLDGLRAFAVLVVIGYHAHTLEAGFGWLRGGFIGVEVFFVVSGYLITTLLHEELLRTQQIDLRSFWLRRARRLLPALFLLLLGVATWSAIADEGALARLRSDLLAALLYFSNWRQIYDHVGYFAALDTPPVLRHLWSLAVEEQWYLIWPLAFGFLVSRFGTRRLVRDVILALALVSAFASPLLYVQYDDFRTNFVYLSTFTRASGLLLGAALALSWNPWEWRRAAGRHLIVLDLAGGLAILGLAVLAWRLGNTSPGTYEMPLLLVAGPKVLPGGLFLVSVLSAVAIAVVVHPGSVALRRVFSQRPVVEIGKRSYGLYLWHWPIFVLLHVGNSSWRLLGAAIVTVVVTEASYRWVELPIRRGRLSDWWRHARAGDPTARRAGAIAAAAYAIGERCCSVPSRSPRREPRNPRWRSTPRRSPSTRISPCRERRCRRRRRPSRSSARPRPSRRRPRRRACPGGWSSSGTPRRTRWR
ncbi:MAG: acyltransferase [Ilumatobacteraceae bacterium]